MSLREIAKEEDAPGVKTKTALSFRHPHKSDAKAVSRLIESCPPLDRNSLYCTLLQCTHFARTCVLAERGGEIVGWVSAYRPPDEAGALFVWQVAVSSAARGEGLGRRLIDTLLGSSAARGVSKLQTTITPSNRASWRLFESVAESRGASLVHDEWFERGRELDADHESERLLTISPLNA